MEGQDWNEFFRDTENMIERAQNGEDLNEPLPNLSKLLEEYQKDFIETYKKILKQNGRVASGQLINNLKTRLEVHGTELQVYLEQSDYAKQINDGRPPTSSGGDGTVRRKIFEWISQKNILPRANDNGKIPTQEQLSYAISNKIHKEGYKGDHSFDRTLESVNSRYLSRFMKALQADFDNYFAVKILHNINKRLTFTK